MLTSSFNRLRDTTHVFAYTVMIAAMTFSVDASLGAEKDKSKFKIDILQGSVLEMKSDAERRGSVIASSDEFVDPSDPDNRVSNFVVGSIAKKNDLLNYCLNISDAATEARSSILLDIMKEREEQMKETISELEKNIEVLSVWMEKRERFVSNAKQSLIAIFETMRPDAAAQQMTELEVGLAAAILMKLKPKVSSVIMSEMKPKHAAMIASVMTSAIGPQQLAKKQ